MDGDRGLIMNACGIECLKKTRDCRRRGEKEDCGRKAKKDDNR